MSIPLRVLVCDDELMARKRVLRLLSELAGIEATFECESGEEVLAKLREEDVDVAILDINMPGLSGLETVMQMPEDRPYVIFLTAHPEHAVQAFDVGAVDYLLKPVDDARLEKAITRARHSLDGGGGNGGDRDAPAGEAIATRTSKLAIATHDGAALVNPGDVTHATFDGALVTVHTAARSILTDDTLQDLEAKLPKGPFER
ncbi:MAG: two-component system, LytTR family, response regulator, partial [Myxococcales bacterium]|nr:two-component system, LytTR family, response regulator [Myxococcales bacterium]